MKRKSIALTLAALSLLFVAACAGPATEPAAETAPADGLSLSSTAFAEGESIPTRYSCDGQDVSPPLSWSQPPEETGAFALIMDDPDAPRGVFTHWVLFNIPADSRDLPEALPRDTELSSRARQGLTSFGRVGYGGPCPPAGPSHRYRFTLYALDDPLSLAAGATRESVLDAMEGHILAQVTLTGRYQR